MTENRYRLDTGCIIDQAPGHGEILSDKQIVNRLNRQDKLIEAKKKAVQFHVDGYNQLIQTIKEAYESERTHIGRNVLRQLMEQIE